MTELEQAYELLHQAEDLLADALSHLEGDPNYSNKAAITAELQSYFEYRKSMRGVGQSPQTEK